VLTIDEEKSRLLRSFVRDIHHVSFEVGALREILKTASSLMDSHYSSFNLFVPGAHTKPNFIISQNPPDFLPVYFSVSSGDYLLRAIVNTRREFSVGRSLDHNLPENREFVSTVQACRPIADIIYHPLFLGDCLCGFWSIASAGLNGPLYTDKQIDLFRFLKNLLQDALERFMIRDASIEETALLDRKGRFIYIGDKLKELLRRICGSGDFDSGIVHKKDPRCTLQMFCRRFVADPYTPGNSRFALEAQGFRQEFDCRLINYPNHDFSKSDLPFASLAPVDGYRLTTESVPEKYCLTDREKDIVLAIFNGMSNKQIAGILCIEESTVKRHIHNIYEKTGFRSRVELVTRFFQG
jgi:DNA-binding CsgD family transcriptional regulator